VRNQDLRRILAEKIGFTEDRQRCSDLVALPLCAIWERAASES